MMYFYYSLKFILFVLTFIMNEPYKKVCFGNFLTAQYVKIIYIVFHERAIEGSLNFARTFFGCKSMFHKL
jgi:hypothetical protein